MQLKNKSKGKIRNILSLVSFYASKKVQLKASSIPSYANETKKIICVCVCMLVCIIMWHKKTTIV